jgi:hypothetical protein
MILREMNSGLSEAGREEVRPICLDHLRLVQDSGAEKPKPAARRGRKAAAFLTHSRLTPIRLPRDDRGDRAGGDRQTTLVPLGKSGDSREPPDCVERTR